MDAFKKQYKLWYKTDMSLIGSSEPTKPRFVLEIKQSNSDETTAKTHYLTSGYTFLSALEEGNSYKKKEYLNIRGNYNVLTGFQEKLIFRESNVSTVFQTPFYNERRIFSHVIASHQRSSVQ